MPNPVYVNPDESPQARFAHEVRRHRVEAGWTQAQLAQKLLVSVSTVGMVETLRRKPDARFAQGCDQAFGRDLFRELLKQTRWETAPEHFRDFMALEAEASALRSWDPLLIPGLFQVERYAQRIFEDEPGITPETVEQRVANRLRRQGLLSRENGPMVLSLIDEGALRRPLGATDVMREQIGHLLEIAKYPRVTIQIVPYGAWSAVGLQAAFTIAEVRGVPQSVYVETAPRGLTIGDREIITVLVGRYDALRAAALPRNLSLDLIEEVMAQWI